MALVRQLQKPTSVPLISRQADRAGFPVCAFSTIHLDICDRLGINETARFRRAAASRAFVLAAITVCTTTSLTQVRLLQHALELMQVYVPVAVGVVLLEHLLDLVVVVPGVRERLEELFLVQ